MSIRQLANEKILILDGAMGTMIQGYNLSESDFWTDSIRESMPSVKRSSLQMQGNNDVLNLSRPDVILDIHRKYLRAGADLIETNTFSAQRISQADYHLENETRTIALEGARLARQAVEEFSTVDKPRFVLGSVGPTNKTCSMSPDVSNPAKRDLTYDMLYDAYFEQMDALIEGGVDAFLIETIFDTLNAKVAIDAAIHAMKSREVDLPIMLSVTVSDLAGRTLSGQTLDAFLASISTYPIFSVGLNCSFGAQQ
ncbi:MAG: homocysteine S-methyltransferase family protein, partial [Prevotella sp.]|nr:homocysteine S-methyltransferase family protein [Prevotella sp.]